MNDQQPLKRIETLGFLEGGLSLRIHGYASNDGSATLTFKDDDLEFEHDDEFGKLYRYIEITRSEVIELRDFLNRGVPPEPRQEIPWPTLDVIRDILRPIVEAYQQAAEPVGDSDLDNDQPRSVATTLGAMRALARMLHALDYYAKEKAMLLQKRPVAWQVKGDDGWVTFDSETIATEWAKIDNLPLRGLYARAEEA